MPTSRSSRSSGATLYVDDAGRWYARPGDAAVRDLVGAVAVDLRYPDETAKAHAAFRHYHNRFELVVDQSVRQPRKRS